MSTSISEALSLIETRIASLTKKPTLSDVSKLKTEIETAILIDVPKLRRNYGTLIKKFYAQNKDSVLFNNHKDPDPAKSDIADFMELVGHAAIAGDLTILDEFAVKYPLENPKVLSRDLIVYVKAINAEIISKWDEFQEALAEVKWPKEIRPYYTYLIERLSSKLGLKSNAS